MTDWFSWHYWYILPCGTVVAFVANASGFSGAVLFQPFFNFVLKLPMGQSIATGVATETIGMSSGALRYLLMRKVDLTALRALLPGVLVGVALGLWLFVRLPRPWLRLAVGVTVAALALGQIYQVAARRYGVADRADIALLRQRSWVSVLAGASSACTGTGVAEVHQPLLERRGGLATKRANATAIAVEAAADWCITLANVSLGNLRLDILLFSTTGVAIGAQIGAMWSPHLPDGLVKSAFGACVLGIGIIYIGSSLGHL